MSVRQVPGLGEVKGLERAEFPDVDQYRGIQYGFVPARFRQSKLVTSWPDGKWDATKYGPLCPYSRIVIGMALTQKALPVEHQYEMDEFKCLQLNISAPKGPAPSKGYPVAVWVHGGGNCIGSGAEPGYDMAAIAEHSIKQGQPTVFVTINYRLGIFGFLASDDLKKDNDAAGDEGVGNYALRDQLLAFEWIRKYISAFGGDPARVTVIGHSAGSIDTHINIISELFKAQKPFHQAILQSGVAPLTVRGMKHQTRIYNKITSYLKIEESTPSEEKIQKLRDLSTEELVGSYLALGGPVPSWQATVDGYFLKVLPTNSKLPQQVYPPSLKRILIGDVATEGLIFAHPINKMDWSGEKLWQLATTVLGEDQARKIFEFYGLRSDADSKDLFPGLIRLASDAEWSQPIEAVAHSFSNGPTFYYHITETNPFPGPNQGRAHHGIDLILNFLTYEKHISLELRKLSEMMAGHWITFTNGGDPWTPYSKSSGNVMRYGDGAQASEISEHSKSSWKSLRLVEGLQDKISDFASRVRGEEVLFDGPAL